MTGIDPTFHTPGAYRVLFDGRECDAFFLPSKSEWAWAVSTPMGLNMRLGCDVTVLHRLVPEPEEKALDVPIQPWDVLRAATNVLSPEGYDPPTLTTVLDVADYLTEEANRLEAEHRAAQEKSEQDRLIEVLAENAFEHVTDVGFGSLSDSQQEKWREAMRRARTHILAEAGEQ